MGKRSAVGWLGRQAFIGSLPQRAVEQQDTRGRITSGQPEGGTVERIAAIERGQVIGIRERAERHHRLSLIASAASVTKSTGIVSVAPTLK